MGFTISTKAKAMMSHANLDQKLCLLLWKVAFHAATKLDNLTVIKFDGKLKKRHALARVNA